MNRRAFLAGAGAIVAAPAVVAAGALVAGNRSGVPATELGVMPNASGDQTSVLQRAMNEAAAAGTPLFLPPGRYVTGTLTLPDRLQLSGVPGETVLAASGNRAILAGGGATRIALDGLVLDGLGRNPALGDSGVVALTGVPDLNIRRLTVRGAGGNGIRIEGCGGRVADCTIAAPGDVGLWAVQSTGLAITGNTVTGAGNTGIIVQRWERGGTDATIVSGNRVTGTRFVAGGNGQHGNGINLVNASGAIVTGNQIDGSALSAIRAYQSSDVVIQGNVALRSGEVAIYVEFAFDGAVVADNVVDGAAGGISITNFDVGGRLATCSGNVVRNIVDRLPYSGNESVAGYGISVVADTAVTGNVIDTCASDGMIVGYGPYLRNVAATGNVIRSVRIGIAVTVVEGAGPALIADNLIAEARMGAIRGVRWEEIATGDLTTPGATVPRHLTLDGNRVA